MVASPIVGVFDVGRSTNYADNQLINLLFEISETKDAKAPGVLYLVPGLTLLATAGIGPIRGEHPFLGLLYVVSGGALYTIDMNWAVTLIGTIDTSSPLVSMIDNGNQMAIFTATTGYLVPGGRPLTGGAITNGGTTYAIGDKIILTNSNGAQNATAEVTVSNVGAGVVTAFTVTLMGAFPAGSLPTSFVQLSTTGSGSGFVLGAPGYGPNQPIYTLALPYTPTGLAQIAASAQQGFGLINQPGTYVWWQSNLLDLSIWDPLKFASASVDPDFIVQLRDVLDQMVVIKQFDTEFWSNAGTAGFSFQLIPGAYLELGCAAVGSVARVGETIIWLAQNQQGALRVVQLSGYQPKVISTHAISYALANMSTTSDAIAYSYQQGGHSYYVINFPTGNQTWVYDATESDMVGVPVWHQRAAFVGGTFNRHWGNQAAFFNGVSVIGDVLTGNLYKYDPTALTDNGAQRKWLRSWRAMSKPTMQPIRFNSLQIDMQTGIAVPDGTNPQCMLRWSDDGAHTWGGNRIVAVGAPGQTAWRVKANRLGSTRRASGLDRIFELSATDQFPVAIIGAELETNAG